MFCSLMSVFMYFSGFESFAPLERWCDFAKFWCGKKKLVAVVFFPIVKNTVHTTVSFKFYRDSVCMRTYLTIALLTGLISVYYFNETTKQVIFTNIFWFVNKNNYQSVQVLYLIEVIV